MRFDFDEVVDRRGSGSLKYDFAARWKMPPDVLPLWVADMDFRTLPEVSEALIKVARHGVLGYADSLPSYDQAVQGWYAQRFDWQTDARWMVKTPGIVFALAMAVRAFTLPGEAVLIQQPVYHPFAAVVEDNGRELVNNALICENGRYRIDFEDFEANILRHKVRLFILCSPHNPVGRVWTLEELTRLGEICLKHGVRVVADEIHADFVHAGHKHRVFASLHPDFARICITCTAPSKTFNLAGLQVSNIFIADTESRRAFVRERTRCGCMGLSLPALVGCEAAYTHGAAWLEELLIYLEGNRAYVRGVLADKLPGIRLVEPEGTYLLWLDCRGLGLTDEERQECIVNRARLWLDPGRLFGPGGEGFERMNIACPRATLVEAMARLVTAVQKQVST